METFNITDAYQLITAKLQHWVENMIAMLPNLALAILVLILFYFIAKVKEKRILELYNAV
jgi:small conductance mechanosensitive channel